MPAATDFSFVFRRPFDEQVAFFRGKLGNLVPTATWKDIMREQHDRAFMVAGAAKADLLADLAAAVDKAIADGESLDAFRRRFGEIVEKRGWHGWTGEGTKAGTNWRTRVIYRTNLATSYAAGRLAQLQHFPLWVYRHSGAEHPRLQHKAWDGMVLPADHEFWRTHYPPNGWNCFTGDTLVRCDALLGQRVWYSGEMVELHTALGHRLAVTAYHPILTRRGWVAAKDIDHGDELIGAPPDIDAALRGIVNREQPPASAKDLFEALSAQGLRVIPVAPDDFYGDARAMKGEIHIAGADCSLMHEVETARRELVGEGRLDDALHRRIEAANVAVGAAQVAPVAAQAAPSQHAEHGRLGQAKATTNGGGGSQPAAIKAQDGTLGMGIAGVCRRPGVGEHALAPAVAHLDVAPGHAVGVGASAQGDASLPERMGDGATAGAMLFGQLLDACAGQVALDHAVEIRKYEWSGHVYDFTTSTGLIIAGGIVVSNCGCRVAGASSPEAARRLGGDPDYDTPPAGWDARDAKGRMPGIDEGWDYMPGGSVAANLRGLIPELIDDPPRGRPMLPPICPDRGAHARGDCPGPLPRPRPFDPGLLLPTGRHERYYIDAFLEVFGMRIGEDKIIEDAAGERIVIGTSLFIDRVESSQKGKTVYKVFKDDIRRRHMRMLAETILHPQEIWEQWEWHYAEERMMLRRRYLALFDIGDDTHPGLSVFEFSPKRWWTGVTAFVPEDSARKTWREYMEDQRAGYLRFRK